MDMAMRAEIISIGDELTSGQRLDTNSQWLSQRLHELGVEVLFHTTVADDLEANLAAFRQAVERVEVVIATGGLGPTADDLTREVLASLTGTELVLNETALAHIKALFARRHRDMPERNVVQALFPAGSRMIDNPHGTAPGIALEVQRIGGGTAQVYALPGVPAEMMEMWQASVAPDLVRLGAGRRVIRHRAIRCFGVGESHLEQMLPDLIRRGRMPSVGITVSNATVTLRITAEGESPDECASLIEPTTATIRECLGEIIFGEEEDELEHAIGRLLTARGETLSTIEWGTAGLIAHWLGETKEARECWLGGAVVHTAEAAARWFEDAGDAGLEMQGNRPAPLDWRNAPADAVEKLALWFLRRTGSDWALAVGPFPQDDPQSPQPGQWHCAVARRAPVPSSKRAAFTFAGHPAILKPRAGKQALNLLRLEIVCGQGSEV
jgi:nicotinamide-nucleotide amidase